MFEPTHLLCVSVSQEKAMNFGLVEILLGKYGHKAVQKVIVRSGKHLALFSALLCAILFSSVAMNALLTTADVIGTVYGSSGAVLPNATVTLTNQATHQTRSAQTGGAANMLIRFCCPVVTR